MLFQIMQWFQSLEKEEGQTLVEYALILVLIAIVVIAVLGLVGDEIVTAFNEIIAGLQTR